MSPTSYFQALSSLTKLLALLKMVILLEICRDGSHVVNALHCDVCGLCMPSGVHCCLFH